MILYYDCESERVKITSHCKFDEGFNDFPIESVPLGFQQLIQENRDNNFLLILLKLHPLIWIFFVYPFADKEITEIPVLPWEKDDHFGFKLKNDELYGRVYIDKIKDRSTVHHAFNKSARGKLRGSFITHIDDEPVFNAKDAAVKLQRLYQDYLCKVQGVAGKNNNNNNSAKTDAKMNPFSFSITFAPEKKLLGAKLKKAMDNYYGYTPGTTKNINSKPVSDYDLQDVDDGTKRYEDGTKIFKIFNDVEYKGTITGYDPKKKLYHILYEDGDMEDFYHNEVKQFHADTVKRYPKKKRWKRQTRKTAIQFIQKFAPTELEIKEHVMSLSVEDITAIASLCNEDVDMSEEAISSEMIKICINTLNSEHMTKEEQALGYFTRKRLKRLSTWQEWKDGETKQIEQFMMQKMFGNPIDPIGLPDSAVIL